MTTQAVKDVLTQNSLDCEILELSEGAKTAQQAADLLECSVSEIVKSLVFKTEESGEPVLILASGSNRVNESAVAAHLGQPIVRAEPALVKQVTGFAIGGVAPIGHKQAIKHILIDADLLQFETAWAAGGTPHTIFNIRVLDLVKITSGQVLAIK